MITATILSVMTTTDRWIEIILKTHTYTERERPTNQPVDRERERKRCLLHLHVLFGESEEETVLWPSPMNTRSI